MKPAAPASTALPSDPAKLKAAALAGDPNAETELGNRYMLGEGVAKDHAEARRWYEMAALKGQPNAAFVLGEIYWNGDDVAKDDKAAAKWWKVAYDHGRDEAAKLLGDEAFARAQAGGGWDAAALKEALDWYQKAAATAGPALQDEANARVKQVKDLIAWSEGKSSGP